MFKRKLLAVAAFLGFISIPGVAMAASVSAVTTADLNIRTGPSASYPRFATIPYGDNVRVYGCLAGYNWCDVGWAGTRGWVSGNYLAYLGERYYRRAIPTIGVSIGLPIIRYDYDDYYDRYYVGRHFHGYYFDRHRRDHRREIRQDRREHRRDVRQERRHERRELRQERREDRREIRRERRQERRQDAREERRQERRSERRERRHETRQERRQERRAERRDRRHETRQEQRKAKQVERLRELHSHPETGG